MDSRRKAFWHKTLGLEGVTFPGCLIVERNDSRTGPSSSGSRETVSVESGRMEIFGARWYVWRPGSEDAGLVAVVE